MTTLFGQSYTRAQLQRRFGDASQLGGITLATLENGFARGTRTATIRTGTGLIFTLLLDRAMDVAAAEHNGRSLCWRATGGDKAPTFFEPDGFGWLRSFFGGLVATCGLTYHGAPGTDKGEPLGLHGRITSIPASNVSIEEGWNGDDYEFSIIGQMRETSVANIPSGPNIAHNLLMTRTVSSALGSNRFTIHDRVENQGFNDAPFMILYHINAGFPVIDDGAALIAPVQKSTPRDPDAEEGADSYGSFHAPVEGYQEKVYFLDMKPDAQGLVTAAIVNPTIDGGFGLSVTYNKNELPYFTEWKMLCAGTYSVGLEPANSYPTGRANERQAGRLELLKPGDVREITLTLAAVTADSPLEAQ